MKWRCFLQLVIILLNFNIKPLKGTLQTYAAGRLDAVTPFQSDQTNELPFLMDNLDRLYTPHCLKVVIAIHESNKVSNSSSSFGKHSEPSSLHAKPNENLIFNFPRTKPTIFLKIPRMSYTKPLRSLANSITNAENSTPINCINYQLSGLPDSTLLVLLTRPSANMRLTRYFLVHTQTSTEAEQFLLDQRLGKEENVAALVQEESQNKSYWRVLIRQLVHPSGSPQVLTVNRWFRDTGLASTENIFPEQMANFHGTKLNAITLAFIPFIAYQKTKGSLKVKLSPCVDKFLLETVAEKLNFTYEVVNPADGHWGYRDEKGQFVGMVREVEVGRANFSLVMAVSQVRSEVIDYSYSYYMDALTFITAKSRPSPPWRKVLTPFRTSVWLCLLVSVGGGALLYHVIYHAQATLTSSRLLSSHAFMHVLASFLSQSLRNYLSLQAGKVFLGFWFLYAFLVTSYYKTSLTSTLAVPFIPKNIDSLQDLFQSGLSYGITPSKGAVYSIFALADIPMYQRMFANLRYHSTPESMRMVEEGQHSFVYWKSYLDPRVARHNNNPNRKNDIHMAREQFFPGRKAWSFPKGAPYGRTMSLVLKRCVQGGLIEKWMKESLAAFLQEWQKEDNPEGKLMVEGTGRRRLKEVVLSLDHLQGPFFMLLLGYIGGGLLLVLEILMGR